MLYLSSCLESSSVTCKYLGIPLCSVTGVLDGSALDQPRAHSDVNIFPAFVRSSWFSLVYSPLRYFSKYLLLHIYRWGVWTEEN